LTPLNQDSPTFAAKVGLGRNYADIVAYSKPDDAMAAFETQNMYAVALFPPFPEQAMIKGFARPLPGPPAPIQVVMVSRGEFARARRNLVLAITQTLDQAKQWIISNPVLAQSIVSEQTGIDLDVVKLSWPRIDWNARLDAAIAQDIQDKADFLKAEQKINNTVDVRRDLLMSNISGGRTQ
jgi:ABC-type nitrate/sulfonate/bicarbonate transport system substrate-binding protein